MVSHFPNELENLEQGMAKDAGIPQEDAGCTFDPISCRIGSVQFLNAVPLTWKLSEIAAALNIQADVTYDTPSRLADGLAHGEYDAALIPLAEALRHPELTQVSDVCIASEGKVASVEFAAFRPLKELNRIGLDPASRTSNAMLRICLEERFKTFCEYEPFDLGEALGLSDGGTENIDLSQGSACRDLAEKCKEKGLDGILLIGDKALTLPHHSDHFACIYDLGHLWTQWIGLPFVYASWFTSSKDTEFQARLSTLFNEARRASQIEMDVLTIHEAMRRRMNIPFCHDYLLRKIRYRLSGRERRGAEVFCKMMQKCGLAPLGTDILFEANRNRFAAGSGTE